MYRDACRRTAWSLTTLALVTASVDAAAAEAPAGATTRVRIGAGVAQLQARAYNATAANWGYAGFGTAVSFRGDVLMQAAARLFGGVRLGWVGAVAPGTSAALTYGAWQAGIALQLVAFGPEPLRRGGGLLAFDCGVGLQRASVSLRSEDVHGLDPVAWAGVTVGYLTKIGVTMQVGVVRSRWKDTGPLAEPIDLYGPEVILTLEMLP